jgi:tetratricopeptide (TPR) repeat protein
MAIRNRHSPSDGGGPGHPALEMLAAYSEGKLPAAEVAVLERHASRCVECRDTLADVSAFLGVTREPKRFHPRRVTWSVAAVLATAAVLLLAFRTVAPERLPRWLGGDDASTALPALLAAASVERTRFSEGRLTGGFPYAPSPSVTRGVPSRIVSPEVGIAAARIEQRASGRDSASDLAALGVAFLALGDPERSITAFERAVALAPDNPEIQSNLAAAYLAGGQDRQLDSDGPAGDYYARAVRAAERALEHRSPPIEAWFNFALALERVGMRDRAAKAWQDYLSRDSSSSWASEARERARRLTSSPRP